MRLSYESVESPFPFLLLIGQQQTEIRLAQRLEALGSHVHRSVTLLDLHDDFPGTAATMVDDDGLVHAVTARYVAGADGVHSSVRRLAGIEFPGDAPTALFALADIVLDDAPADNLDTTFSLSPHGMLITSALPGDQLRVVAGVTEGTPEPDKAAIADLLDKRTGGWIRDSTITSVAASSTYRVQQRVAATLRRGNFFLLGDAAHTHSPAGGQGMNTGIQDAANLGWKLHHVLTGRATPELLNSYDTERRPVAAHLIAFTSQLMQVATITEPAAARLRNETLAAAAQVPGVTDWLARNLSQLDIGYNTDHGETLNGTRVDPRTSKPHGLSWTFIADECGRRIAVRPDGIAADQDVLSERFGIDLDE